MGPQSVGVGGGGIPPVRVSSTESPVAHSAQFGPGVQVDYEERRGPVEVFWVNTVVLLDRREHFHRCNGG